MNLGRNKPCHCGSGIKYKKCCLAKDKKPKLKATKPKLPEPDVPKMVTLDMRHIAAHLALAGGLAQEFPQPIRNQGMEGFFDELRRQGHTEEEVKEAREILKERHR